VTNEQATAVRDLLVDTMEQESVATRKVIAAIPNGNRDYKPDPKSRSAWELAVHLVTSDIWFTDCIVNGEFGWTGDPPTPPEMTDPAAVARHHEQRFGECLARLRAMTPAQLLKQTNFFGAPGPVVAFLPAMNNHTIHHRGQLAAYLRASGSKVPAIYGISADENLFAQPTA
jgi:uncharacterized damage-inducible protein DinB